MKNIAINKGESAWFDGLMNDLTELDKCNKELQAIQDGTSERVKQATESILKKLRTR